MDRVNNCRPLISILITMTISQVLVVEQEYLYQYSCSLHSVNMDGWTSFIKNLDERNNVSDLDMFYAQCGSWYNFYQRLNITQNIQEKQYSWKAERPGVHQPTNVLFIGLSTVSRSHFHRSLPKTAETLRSLGFVEYKRFHSLSPHTMVNMAAFVMGLKSCVGVCGRAFEHECATNLNDYLDECPMIFKDYNESAYVTLYMDNSNNEFGSFQMENPMTDFYIKPIFDIVRQFRISSKTPKEHRSCFSVISETQFMLDYVSKFMRTFKQVPFLSFSWFGRPFQQYPHSLPHYDKDFEKFFDAIPKILLRNTLIIVAGDHGDKFRLFDQGIEGFLERSLPPLFIRIPENIVNGFPQKAMHLKRNSNRLTSAFDVHHTLLHLLKINCSSDFEDGGSFSKDSCNFRSVLSDRVSLFEEVPTRRTCETFHVPTFSCLCNVTGQAMASDALLKDLSPAAFQTMNALVKDSKFGNLCDEWTSEFPEKSTAYYLVRNRFWATLLLRVFATATTNKRVNHYFEMQLNISMDELGSRERITIVPGSLSRIHPYGNKTWCVNAQNADELLIKDLCYCLGPQ